MWATMLPDIEPDQALISEIWLIFDISRTEKHEITAKKGNFTLITADCQFHGIGSKTPNFTTP